MKHVVRLGVAVAAIGCGTNIAPPPQPDPCIPACANVAKRGCNRLGSKDVCEHVCHSNPAYNAACVASDAPCEVLERCR